MGIFDFFRKQESSASKAKERLQIVVSHQRAARSNSVTEPLFMEEMKREILAVVGKYFQITLEDIEANLERDSEKEVLALNINLPEKKTGTDGNAEHEPR